MMIPFLDRLGTIGRRYISAQNEVDYDSVYNFSLPQLYRMSSADLGAIPHDSGENFLSHD